MLKGQLLHESPRHARPEGGDAITCLEPLPDEDCKKADQRY
jgi:hypothetical protein